MRIINFAWTTPALLAGVKTVTRRGWSAHYARQFKPGELVQAYDRNPRQGGRPVAILRLTSIACEPDAAAPDSDYEAEGFAFLAELADLPSASRSKLLPRLDRAGFDTWRQAGGNSWVVRFELVERLVGSGQ